MSADDREQENEIQLLVGQLRASIERAARYRGFHFAVLCVDVHIAGDAGTGPASLDGFVNAAAARLEATLRVRETPPTFRHHDLVARLGSGRLAVLLDGLKDLGHVAVVAERTLTALRSPFTLEQGDAPVVVSIGIAVSATGYTEPEHVFRDAAAAAACARLTASGYDVFDQKALESAQAELQLEADFDGALDRSEFRLAYQPIVSLESNGIVGFEALVRWQHPVLGLIAPLDFIPLAEQCGFIVPLGHWVIGEACRQLKAWQDARPGMAAVWISVNMSSPQLRRAAIVEEIAAILRETGLDARSLVLELTEGTAMENPLAVRALLIQLRALGVRVSVDDFGTGHSSLAYLRQFPLDSLKVDRSFIRGIESSPELASIVSAITLLARQLGLRVIAEGIEKDEQLAVLRALRCECGQGYLFSRPVDPVVAAALLDSGLPARPAPPLIPLPLVLPAAVTAGASATARPWTMRYLVAAAAVAALMLSIGLPRLVDGPREFDAPAPSNLPAVPGPVAPTPTVDAASPPATAEPAVPAHGGTAARKAAPSARPSTAPSGPAPATAATTRFLMSPPPAAPSGLSELEPVPNVVASLRVSHQHLLGSCRGLLVVSREGVSFTPDGSGAATGKDGFTLRYAQFVEAFDGGTLVIKSNSRDYRFKPTASNGRDGGQLEEVAGVLARIGQR